MKRLYLVMVVALISGMVAFAGGKKKSGTDDISDPLYRAAVENGGIVSSYDTGPTWANWSEEFKAFEAAYDRLTLEYNDLGSGATVARLEKEALNPQADTAYYSFIYGEIAKNRGVTAPYEPTNFEKLPDTLKDPEGHWFSIHMGTVSFAVNTRLVENVPQTWTDLLKPEYKNMIVYLDPRTTGIGLSVVVAAAIANGGDENNLTPGVEFLAELQESGNVKSIDTTVATAKFLKGEIPIWISYDFNHYKAKWNEGAECEIVIPQDGTVTVPYVVSLVKEGPNPEGGKLWLNWMLSEEGQKIFAEGFVRPVVPGIVLPTSVQEKFLPMTMYDAARNVDWNLISGSLEEVKKAWEENVIS